MRDVISFIANHELQKEMVEEELTFLPIELRGNNPGPLKELHRLTTKKNSKMQA